MSNCPNSVVDSWNPNSRIRMGIGIAIPKKKLYECEWELELKNLKKITIPIHNKRVLNQFLTKIYLTNIRY